MQIFGFHLSINGQFIWTHQCSSFFNSCLPTSNLNEPYERRYVILIMKSCLLAMLSSMWTMAKFFLLIKSCMYKILLLT
jgi:hypothetical protein